MPPSDTSAIAGITTATRFQITKADGLHDGDLVLIPDVGALKIERIDRITMPPQGVDMPETSAYLFTGQLLGVGERYTCLRGAWEALSVYHGADEGGGSG